MKEKKFTNSELHPPHPIKAYDNKVFIHSSEGRIIRILAEYLYPEQHLRKHGIKKTIIFFGSARVRSREDYAKEIASLQSQISESSPKDAGKIRRKIKQLEKLMNSVATYYEQAYELSKMVAEWSKKFAPKNRFYICTGGGPGIMEAANRGAYDAGLKTIGFNISLPFEQVPNSYITKELNFEFHYFFMRKFWLVYPAQVLIVFPGGFGTIDEMMEILTLRQTKKMKKPRLIILYSSEYWKNVINFDYLVEMGMINRNDLNIFEFADTPEQAFTILKKNLEFNIKRKSNEQ
jgi:uncharacterized protein (TIGR00730 family)